MTGGALQVRAILIIILIEEPLIIITETPSNWKYCNSFRFPSERQIFNSICILTSSEPPLAKYVESRGDYEGRGECIEWSGIWPTNVNMTTIPYQYHRHDSGVLVVSFPHSELFPFDTLPCPGGGAAVGYLKKQFSYHHEQWICWPHIPFHLHDPPTNPTFPIRIET